MRVGALLEKKGDVVYFFGYGDLLEDDREIEQEHLDMYNDKRRGYLHAVARMGKGNIKIKLDSGKTVYGCECWWADVERIKRLMKRCKVINVDIDEVRKGNYPSEENIED